MFTMIRIVRMKIINIRKLRAISICIHHLNVHMGTDAYLNMRILMYLTIIS